MTLRRPYLNPLVALPLLGLALTACSTTEKAAVTKQGLACGFLGSVCDQRRGATGSLGCAT